MFCLRKGTKSSKDYRLATNGSASSLDECLTDSNASFLRAARAGNLEKVLEYLKGNIDINTSNANGLNALHLASKEGHVNVVTELLKRGANVNAATKKGNTALHIASLAGQYEVVKVLVNLGANVNVQSQNGFTPLYMAAQENHDNVVSFLLANGANQSLATEDGFTPLAVALQQGHDKVVAVLLENDTKGKVRLPALHIAAKKDDCKAATLLLQNDHNPDVTSKSGFTPLHIAAHYGNENIAHILLDKGADVNYAAKHQITPLHVASKWGKSNMVTLLLDKGANIEASTRDGLTPLHCAARSGHDQVVDLLLERGAPILAKTKNGLAPLHMASQGDHVDSARILLYHKAPVDDVTVDYLTALHVAAHCGHVKVAKLLLDRKADPNARALNGFTPLHIACKKNRIKVVELLLKHGASIEATTESGLTPLHVASFMGCMNIVIYLIQNGANPDVPTVRGETPLHLAARANQTDIIRILLRNGANVDARAREEQTPLHIAARLGNVDIVSLLLQHGAAVDATTKDMYTALHIAAKEDQEEVASVLLDHGASLTSTTKKGFTPLHLAAKYGNIKVARLLLQKDAPVDAQGKNGVTPLHVASHYDHVNVALLLLDKGASPHAMAKNGYTPLHIAAKKNQMDIATTLLEYGAKANSESKAGFTPLHLASQDGHTDMTTLLIEHQADVNYKANNGLTPLHLCAQEDRVNVATVLVKNGAEVGPQTKAGYTPLHVASHFGQINMVRFLLQQNADVHMTTSHGYTPLHQAAQQGHTLVVNLLLENQASPNVTTSQGQTALSIAQRLGYISVVETLKVVTETTVTTTTTTVTEEKYKVVAPETMQETFMTDSEDEGGEDVMLGDQSYRYLTADEMKSLGDDSLPIDVTKDEKQHEAIHPVNESPAPMVEEDHISPQHITPVEVGFSEKYSPDNVDLSRAPVHAGHFRDFDWDDTGYFSIPSQGMLRSSRLKWKTFLVSFMVDARGGAMRGCRHSGVRVIIPPRKASMPMRITCRYLRKEKLIHPPPLMEGEACASRILEVGPVGARFLGPVIIEVPHFASLRGKEREITILRSDTGETWREHTLEASEEAVQEVLNESFEGDELSALEDLNTNRITRILTTDFPQYFAIVTRIRQEVHGVGPEGGMVSSTVVPQVQAIFPEGALTKKIRVGLQAQPIAPELVAKLLGNRVAVSPIVTVEPRRRKFHKPITLTIPVPQAATKGMINQYSGDAPTLRLLCSITGGSSKAQWEDVTGSTPLQFVSDCVSFTTTVSARFWLMDCRQVNEASKFATELYQEAVHVPFMSKFVIFAKRNEPNEAHLRVFCMTDDKEDKTLETQENFTEIAKSRDVEVLEGKLQYLEFAGNLVPVTKSGEQLKLAFQAFHENRLAFTIRVKDPHVESMGRIAFMKEPKVGRGEPPQVPICNLNVALPEVVVCDSVPVALELVTLEKRDDFIQESGLSKPESIHRADLRLSDIARELDKDWVGLAQQLEISESDINVAKSEFPEDISEQALTMLRLWLQKAGSRATGNELEKALRKINREDIIKKCMFNVELVTDDVEKAVAKVHLDQSGFDVFKEELGSSREASMRRGASLDISYDEQDIMKDAESAAETSSETGSIFERDQISQVFSDEKDRFIEEARIRRVSKTPPPSPAEFITKEFIEEKPAAEEKVLVENELLVKEDIIIKEEVPTAAPKPTETVDEIVKPMIEVPEVTAKQTESETWPSGEMDTSQVSVSSLPDDEKSETTTATVSSATAADAETETKVVETKEWTETDDSGAIKHVVQKTTHMTLSMQQKSDDMPDEEGQPKEVISELHIPEEFEEPKLDGSTEVLDESMGNISRESSELSFAEKRDFFQRLSLSSSSPTVTPSPSIKGATTEESTIQQPIVDDTSSPEEQLSFAERLKFFEKTGDGSEKIVDSISETKTEMWTVVSQIDGKLLAKDVVASEIEAETHVISTEEIVDSREIKESCDDTEQISEPSSVLGETVMKTKVEVLVKKFTPGKEAVEICTIENIEGTIAKPTESSLPCSEPPRVEAEGSTVINELEIAPQDEEKEHIAVEPVLPEKITEITSIAEEKISEITSMAEEKILALGQKEYLGKDEELHEGVEFTRNDLVNNAVVGTDKTEDLVVSPAPSLTLETVKVFTLKEGEVKIMDPNSKISPDSTGEDFKVNFDFEKISLERESLLPQRGETESLLELEKEVSESKVIEEPEIDEPLFEKAVDLKVEGMISSLRRLVESKESYSSHEAHKEEISEKEKRAFKPDVVEPSQNQSEGTSNEKEIFICTEHTLDNVKMILSAAEAESSVVQDPTESSSNAKEIFICTEQTLDSVRMILSEAEAESNVVLPHFDSFSQDERQKFVPASEEVVEPVLEARKVTKDTSELKYREEEKEKAKSPDSSEGRSESSLSGSFKDRSVEINNVEIVPVLEVSEEISEISVDMTGHEASGTECSFHKEVPCEEYHKAKEKLTGDEAGSDKVPVSDMVEKAEFEDVEKMMPEIEGEKEKSTKEKVVQRTYTDREKAFKETLESVEITHYKEFSKEVYSISPDQYKGKISTTQIHVEPISHERESSDFTTATRKLDDFLKSVTQTESVNDDFSLPPNLDVVDKRTEEWIDKSGEIMLKDDSLKEYQIEGPDNGITFEERAQTFDDELQKRSSPTAESFDDEARVEKCDTDIMMQLLDYVSRSDIELAEVRTEDEAPDIEEDVSPSGEEESHTKIIQDEIKTSEKKIVEAPSDAVEQVKKQLRSEESLRIEPDHENLLASPLRSSFDSVTSPSRKDATSDDTDITTKEVKFQEEPIVMKSACSREFQPQSSLEVEVGSRDSDEAVAREGERDREIILLADVEEEQHPDDVEPHLECDLESTKGKPSQMETAETASGAEHASPDQLKPASEVMNIEVDSHLPDDIQAKEEPIHVCDMQIEPLEIKELLTKETVTTRVTTETSSGPDESEILVPSSVTTIQSTTTVRSSASLGDTSEPVQQAELQSEKFVPLAFINTAFVGADLIDAAEEAELSRSRSPYEVLREELVTDICHQPSYTTTVVHEDEKDSKSMTQDTEISGDVFVTELKEYSEGEKIYDHTGQIKQVVKSEVRRRPVLQHIPSEISEEDLVEREICSPVSKIEFSPGPLCENLVEDSDKFAAKSSVFPEEQSKYSFPEAHDFASHDHASLFHSGSEFKFYEEIHPSEVVESTEEIVHDESGFQAVRTTIFETVITSHISDSSVDVGDTVKSKLSSEGRESSFPPEEAFDQESEAGREEIRVTIDDSMSVGPIYKTVGVDLTSCDEPEIGELTSPESDTGVPTSPFECASEIDLSEYDHKSCEVKDTIIDAKPLSKTEEHKDSLLTSTATFTQSFSETLNVSIAKITDSAPDSSFDEKKSARESGLSADDSFSDIESISHTSPKKSKICDTKTHTYEDTTHEKFPSQINGPVQVDYKPEFDDEEYKIEQLRSICDGTKTVVLDTVSKGEDIFAEEELGLPEEFLGAVGGMADVGFVSAEAYKEECISSDAHQRSGDSCADAEPGKPYYFGSVSDDTVDAEIGKILSSKAETEEDIIERPRTPEPPEEVHLQEGIEDSIQSAEREVFHADHPIEKTKRTIEGVLDIDIETNSLKFQLTSSTSHSEWETSETAVAVKGQGDSGPVSDPRVLEETHFESCMQLPIELSCPAVGTTHDADSTLSPSITQSSCISEDSSGFVYGMQFEKESEEQGEEAMDIDSDQCSDEKDSSYAYGMRFEREHELDDEDDDIPNYGDLYTHQEEDEDIIDEGEKVKMQFSSSRPLTYEKPSYSDYDTLAGRKFFGKANELDDISMSSLQEFEKLEEEIVSGRKSSIGSVDSFNGKQVHSKSGEHDDISMNSLTEFEKLERECAEAERAEAISQEVNARLSEIEEGHESQSSEASQETISDAAREDDSDVSDFDNRLNKFDKIIKEAQTNVEFFGDKSAVSILSQNTDQKSDVFSDDSLSISAGAAIRKGEEVTETTSMQKLSESSADAVSLDRKCVHEFLQEQVDSPTVISRTVVKEVSNPDGTVSKITAIITEKRQVTKISSISSGGEDEMTSEQIFGVHKREDIDQDSLHEDKSIKPDSLCGEEKFEYQDSLHEDKSADIDSLQEEVPDIMKDSLHEERPLDEDSLHEMDILPDESSLSLETSLPAADDPCQDLGKREYSEFAYVHQFQTHDQDVDADSLKDLHVGDTRESAFTNVPEGALVDGGRVGDLMISSTDSLERSSSAATHATYQFETESIMSSSINSVQTSDDCTMVSSTDTVDTDIKISYGFSGSSMSDIQFLTKDGHQKIFIDSEGNIQTQQDLKVFTDVEGNIQNTVMIPSDTNESVASEFPFSESAESDYETCRATVTYEEGMKQIKHSTPILRHQSDDTDESQSEYTDKSSGQFDPDVEIEEIQTVDDKGNPVTVRRIRRMVETKSQTFTSSSSGNNIEEKFKKFLKDHAGGSDAGKGEEEFEEERRLDEKGNVIIVRTIKQQILTEPEIHSKTFKGPNAEELSSSFIKSFQTIDPTETMEQYEKVDDDGNIIRVTQQVVMKPEMHTLTFSGPDAHRQMEEYMKQWTASQDDLRTQDLIHMESSPCSSKVTDASQLHYISSHPTSAPCDSFGSQISSGETSQSQTFETIADSQPGSVTTARIVTTTTVHHIPEDDGAFSSSPVVPGDITDSHQGAQDGSDHLSSEHPSFHVDDH